MSEIAIATIVAKNYLAFARVLAASLRRYHPEIPFFVLLTDEVDGYFVAEDEPFPVVPLSQLAIPDATRLCHRYSCKQLATAAKPWLLQHVLDRGFRSAVFLDPDILVSGDLSDVLALVGRSGIVLTPHLLAPLEGDDAAARELNILQSGTYNAGFVGVTDTPDTRRFLRWWQERVHDHCRHDVAEGLYFDQRWLDLAAVYFEDVSILRDPTCNVAHWNLPERKVRIEGDMVLVDGRPCRFFHCSGFDPDAPDRVTRYSRRLSAADIGAASQLLRSYGESLARAGYHETKTWPYAYDHPARSVAARMWRRLRQPRRPPGGAGESRHQNRANVAKR